ncbi:hypothetical protein PHMEG_00035770 [Phytophthora megakarya]|uniref:DDE-1 domain-containing protein n=1 Tax=Phytophthora megakarya TaxID=4795 RepID=A0A225UNI6_9STRA|nr:hypothetical protein PHMEG_00035770 [Phytophthora megakarya]
MPPLKRSALNRRKRSAKIKLYGGFPAGPLKTKKCQRIHSVTLDAPSVLRLDNVVAHVSTEGIDIVSETTSAIVCQLPTKSTAVCQPLDVGVMGPLKKNITAKWLSDTRVPPYTRHNTIMTDNNQGERCANGNDPVRQRKSENQAAEKRRATVGRTIETVNQLSSDVIVTSFEKAIPMYQTVIG